jgi:hypothetical protein
MFMRPLPVDNERRLATQADSMPLLVQETTAGARQDGADRHYRSRGQVTAVPSPAMMTTARDVMHAGVACAGKNETLAKAARRMRDLDVGACPGRRAAGRR